MSVTPRRGIRGTTYIVRYRDSQKVERQETLSRKIDADQRDREIHTQVLQGTGTP